MKQKKEKEKEETKKWGAKISAPTLKLNQKLSQVDSVNPKKKKKKSFSKFLSIFQNPKFQFKIFIPKFLISHYQCPNAKLKS